MLHPKVSWLENGVRLGFDNPTALAIAGKDFLLSSEIIPDEGI